MKLLYFAWLREKIGKSEETLDPPAEVATVESLLEWLRRRGPEYEAALADLTVVKVAVNQDFARLGDAVTAQDEVALFPPVTGG